MTKLSKNALKLIKNLKSFVPSTQSLRSSEAIIKTIQDLYEQCLEFIRVFGGVVAQITQEGEGYYKDQSDNKLCLSSVELNDLINQVGESYGGIICIATTIDRYVGVIDFSVVDEIFGISVPIAYEDISYILDSTDFADFENNNSTFDFVSLQPVYVHFKYNFQQS